MSQTTFNNDPAYKQQLLDMAAAHRMADEFAKGTYGKTEGGKFRACSIGCTIRDVNALNGTEYSESSHSGLALTLLGSDDLQFIPRLADTIFENLPGPLHTQWTERWIAAVPVGADPEKLKLVLPRFLLKTLDRLPETDRADVVASIKGVKEVLRGWIDAGAPDEAAAEAAAEAAEAARAAWAAAWAAAWEEIANDLIGRLEECA